MKTMEKIPTTHPLKTFHLKTVLYWVLESTGDTSMWWEENLIKALRNVLMYLQNSLRNKMLLHYFTETNLFLDFETDICSALVAEIDKILDRPVACLQSFFVLENQGDIEVILTNNQVKCLIDMSHDGGVENEANVIEDIMEDFMRGFQEAPKDENEDVPIKQAMGHVMQLVLEDETNLRKEKTWIRKQRGPHSNTFDVVLSMQDSDMSIGDVKDKDKHNKEKTDTLRQDRKDLGQQLAEAASAFVFKPLSTKDKKSLEGNLKQKGLKYFLEEPLD